MAETDTSPLPDAATEPEEPCPVDVENVHGQEVLVTRCPDPEYPDDAELIREKLRDQQVVVTRSGEYSLDEAGSLVFVPYPDLGPARP